MEHKAELDAIKVTYARMQAQLDETHRLLNEEHRRRFRLEVFPSSEELLLF